VACREARHNDVSVLEKAAYRGEIRAFGADAVAPQTTLVTDDWPFYHAIPGIKREAIIVGPMAAHIALPWNHRLFANLKRWGLRVYHGLRRTNLQAPLPWRYALERRIFFVNISSFTRASVYMFVKFKRLTKNRIFTK
jgi:hypothetical protein